MKARNYACVQCGKCCHGLRLPLSVAEAIRWLERGGTVELVCEAILWPGEPPAEHAVAAYKRARSFPATSGAMPIRVTPILLATFPGACPNLLSDGRCGWYEDRPQACRIYPAEVNPFIAVDPGIKLCPPEAWEADAPFIDGDGQVVEPVTQAAVVQRRLDAVADVATLNQVCAALGLASAALANEGFLSHRPERASLLAALRSPGGDSDGSSGGSPSWTIVSNQQASVDALGDCGCDYATDQSFTATGAAADYLGFQARTVASGPA